MKLKNMYILLMIGMLMLLVACGGGSTSSTGSITPAPSVTSTPTTGTDSITPTPIQTAPQATHATGSTQVVMIIDKSNGSYSFSPAMLTIKVGTTVIWKNVSSAPHTITTDDGQTADSGTVGVGATFRFTFKTAGTFSYHCNYHPYMRATIVVV